MHEGSSSMSRAASIAWAIIVNLVQLAVIFTLLRAGADRFQRLALTSIVMVYLTASMGFEGLAIAIADGAVRRSRQFCTIANHLKDSAVTAYGESLAEAEDQFSRIQRRWYIDGTGYSLAWLLSLWTLWRTL